MSLVYVCRLLGLFMLLPVLAPAYMNYAMATNELVGIAAGIYGLPQAVLQIPLGYLSDKYGRKNILIMGLLCLTVGSCICWFADNIYYLIIGRAVQGFGAVGSVISAVVIDHTRPQLRAKAMAIIGVSIGLSFLLAIVFGTLFNYLLGVKGIFAITILLSLMSIAIVMIYLPKKSKVAYELAMEKIDLWYGLKKIFTKYQIVLIMSGIFVLHAILSLLFLMLPFKLKQLMGSGLNQTFMYLIVLFLGMLIAFIFIHTTESLPRLLLRTKFAMLAVILSLLGILLGHSTEKYLLLFLTLFFSSFCFLEASLPSLMSKFAILGLRGLSMGCFAASQFFGIFIGSSIGGVINTKYGNFFVIYIGIVLASLWLFMAGYESIIKRRNYSGQRRK